MEGDGEKLKSQFVYLRRIKRMIPATLRKHHREVMRGTKYAKTKLVKPPRSLIEKRCFYLFCMKHYHFPRGSAPRIMFFKLAKATLMQGFNPLPPKEEESRKKREQYEMTHLFSKVSINAMHHNQVDKYLLAFGIHVEVPYKQKRMLLWELHRYPTRLLPKTMSEKGAIMRPRHLEKMRLENTWNLRDLILENPTMGYVEFSERYGNDMPMTSSGSFKVTRSQLKRAGYEMPDLRKHGQAVIKKDKTTKRGKKLNARRDK